MSKKMTVTAIEQVPEPAPRKPTPDEFIQVVMQFQQSRQTARNVTDVRLGRLLFVKRMREIGLFDHIDWSAG